MLQLSPYDFLTLDETFSVHCFGQTGSGKSSGSISALRRAFLLNGVGALVLTAKPDDTTEWLREIEKCGRSHDVIVVSPENSQNRFNFLDYELHRGGRGAGQTENIVNLLITGVEATEQSTGGDNEKFFHRATKQMLRNAIDVQIIALNKVSLLDTMKIIATAPQSVEEANSEEWRKSSYCFSLLYQAMEAPKSEIQQRDFAQSVSYWSNNFPSLAARTRTSIIATFTSMADSLVRGVFYDLFCTETTFTPDDCRNGKIIILDLNIKDFGELGKIAQILIKYCFQKRLEQQQGGNPVCIFVDESHSFLENNLDFFTTARSANIFNIYASQTIENYIKNGKSEAEVKAFLSNFTLQIFHSNNNAATNYFASEMVTKLWQTHFSINSNTPNQNSWGANSNASNGSSGVSSNRQFEYELPPRAFTHLRTGGAANNFLVDAIIIKMGTPFSTNGKNFMKLEFNQQL